MSDDDQDGAPEPRECSGCHYPEGPHCTLEHFAPGAMERERCPEGVDLCGICANLASMSGLMYGRDCEPASTIAYCANAIINAVLGEKP